MCLSNGVVFCLLIGGIAVWQKVVLIKEHKLKVVKIKVVRHVPSRMNYRVQLGRYQSVTQSACCRHLQQCETGRSE
jgi:hypothetical protein